MKTKDFIQLILVTLTITAIILLGILVLEETSYKINQQIVQIQCCESQNCTDIEYNSDSNMCFNLTCDFHVQKECMWEGKNITFMAIA